ncbi:MAG: T9SS type A sorting domain-containing protein [Bacteroidales bacterium]|nr:T9SS type A sorting domain-containing protein [Bacteroidales bacterium]MCF8455342.1 T9SS type A sorting domain-containing protein [Bacteroidales bacterium]
MKKILFTFTIILFVQLIIAQDTLVVQTFTFDSITTRRGVFQFPDSTHNYRKVLMEYTLKCDAATTHDQFDCGEWDYLTYTYVYDHTGELDSTLYEHPRYKMVNTVWDTIAYTTEWPYIVNQEYQQYLVVDSIVGESNFSIGSSPTIFPLPGFGSEPEGRVQFYYSAADLLQTGMLPGEIDMLKLKFEGSAQHIPNLTIKLKNDTINTTENGFDNSGLTEVYKKDTDIDPSDWQTFNFKQAFNWDGVSGILVELSFTGKYQLGPILIYGAAGTNTSCVYTSESDHFIKIDGQKYVSVDIDSMAGLIDNEITITFWQYGDPAIQPQSDHIFEARNASNQRVLNSHLPWGNGNVYWDAGNTGSNYDRIYKAADTSQYAGQWNHWAMTKNATTGFMRIYLNGQLWYEESGKTKTMTGITKFNIGANGDNTTFYDGYIDEFTIFSKELPDTIIQEYMNRKIDPSHPFAANLLASIYFDEGAGYMAEDLSGVGSNAVLMGAPQWGTLPGDQLRMNSTSNNMLPNIIFVQGEYLSHIDSTVSVDTSCVSPMSVVEYTVGNNEFTPMDTSWVFLAGWQYVYNPANQVIDSNYFAPADQYINSTISYYGEPFEVIDRYEIGRFITPYGIGLTLGPNGFTWLYDVTDYAFLLNDGVDISAGNQQELLDVKFIMIEGTPPRDFVELTRPWGQMGSKSYKALDNDDAMKNKTVALNPLASTFKMKTRLTGHGHNTSTGSYPHCCEWWDNTHYLMVNSDTVSEWHIWETYDCAQNPVYPQGGTWPGSREGWCPGDKVKEYEFEITDYVTGSSVDVDYEISDVPSFNPGMGNGNYVMAMHLFQYGAPNFTLDAEIVDVISPNLFGYQSRKNPVCDGAEVVIRNSGATPITSLVFTYKVSGGLSQQYTWTGYLEFMQKEIVNLPVPGVEFWLGNGDNVFEVSVSTPNNGIDQYADNDYYRTKFEIPPVYNDNFIIMYITNHFPEDNYYEIKDINGNIVASRYTAVADTTYNDTLNLPPGCYTFEFYDTGHDGLYYYFYSDQGTGHLRFKKMNGVTLKMFEPDFGYKIHQAFVLAESISIHSTEDEQIIQVFPNPAHDNIYVDVSGYTGEIEILLLDFTGRKIYSKISWIENSATETIQLNSLAPGAYLIRATGEGLNYSKQIIVQ